MEQQDGKKATIHDVAARAEVSVATVSRALNHPNKVRSRTYRKVMEAIEQLGYGGANRLAGANVILIVVPDMDNSFYSEIMAGVFAAASRSEYHFLLRQTSWGGVPTAETLRELCEVTRACGILFLVSVSPETIATLQERVAVVQCCECNLDPTYSYVTVDDYEASRNVVRYLAANGKRRIAFINSGPNFKYARERARGFRDAMAEAGLTVNPAWILEVNSFRYEPVISLVTQAVISSREPPDAIFAVSDLYGTAAVKAIRSCGLRVPQDIGVVGFDNTYLSFLCEPALTTVSQPKFQLGNLACEMLIERIQNRDAPPRNVVLGTELIIRDSV